MGLVMPTVPVPGERPGGRGIGVARPAHCRDASERVDAECSKHQALLEVGRCQHGSPRLRRLVAVLRPQLPDPPQLHADPALALGEVGGALASSPPGQNVMRLVSHSTRTM
jgi:hypothetical protein